MRHRFSLSGVRRALSLSRSFSASAAAPSAGPAAAVLPGHQPTKRVSTIVEEISCLTLLEVADLTEALRARLGLDQMPAMVVMSPGMSLGGAGPSAGAGVADAPAAAEEKTAFDLKLETFEAAAKIKIIKEVRTFTDLGLKEAKELVEKAPAVLKQGVPKEEAEKIVEKMKELGAKVILE